MWSDSSDESSVAPGFKWTPAKAAKVKELYPDTEEEEEEEEEDDDEEEQVKEVSKFFEEEAEEESEDESDEGTICIYNQI